MDDRIFKGDCLEIIPMEKRDIILGTGAGAFAPTWDVATNPCRVNNLASAVPWIDRIDFYSPRPV